MMSLSFILILVNKINGMQGGNKSELRRGMRENKMWN